MQERLVCSTCNQEKSAEEFYACTKTLCKECAKVKSRKYYRENKDAATKQNKKYYESHREEALQYKKLWYSENKDRLAKASAKRYQEKKGEIKKYLKDYYISRRDELKNRARDYYHKNRERIILKGSDYCKRNQKRVYLYKCRYRANHRIERRESDSIRKNKERLGDLKYSQWTELLERYDNKCIACGSSEKLSMDHIVPLSKGGLHTIDNVQPLCFSCNCRKGTKTIDYRQDYYEYT